MKCLNWMGGSSAWLLMTLASIGMAPAALAGPNLFFYYDYLKLSTSDCVTRSYQVLRERALQIPSASEREGRAFFATGKNQSTTVIIDCTDVAKSGRVTVMATSNDPAFSLSYPRTILNGLKRFAR